MMRPLPCHVTDSVWIILVKSEREANFSSLTPRYPSDGCNSSIIAKMKEKAEHFRELPERQMKGLEFCNFLPLLMYKNWRDQTFSLRFGRSWKSMQTFSYQSYRRAHDRQGWGVSLKLIQRMRRPLSTGHYISSVHLRSKKQKVRSRICSSMGPSVSPYGAPILFVAKKDGDLWFRIDHRWLNKQKIRNWYPWPLPEEMLERLCGPKFFNKIDLKSRYLQMPMRDKDILKIAFRTRWGLYEFLVVLFGVANAPS